MAKKNTTITSFIRRISRLSKVHFVVRALARCLCTMLLFHYKASIPLNAYRLKLKKQYVHKLQNDRRMILHPTCRCLYVPGVGGGGVLPYMGSVGMYCCEGYGFQAGYSRIGYINKSVWISKRVSFFRKLISWLKINFYLG